MMNQMLIIQNGSLKEEQSFLELSKICLLLIREEVSVLPFVCDAFGSE